MISLGQKACIRTPFEVEDTYALSDQKKKKPQTLKTDYQTILDLYGNMTSNGVWYNGIKASYINTQMCQNGKKKMQTITETLGKENGVI